jgi:hypothetical protein
MLAFFYSMYRLSGHVLVATGLVSCWIVWSLRGARPALMTIRNCDVPGRMVADRIEEPRLIHEDVRLVQVDHASLATDVGPSHATIVRKDSTT